MKLTDLVFYKCLTCKEIIQKHIVEENSRLHVLRWSKNGTRCSELQCEINHNCEDTSNDPRTDGPT